MQLLCLVQSFTVTESGGHGEQKVCSRDGSAICVLLKRRRHTISLELA